MIYYDPFSEEVAKFMHGVISFDELVVKINKRGEDERREYLRLLKEKIAAEEAKKTSGKGLLFGVSL